MTLPDEEQRSLNWARDFLEALLIARLTPRVPSNIREQAFRVLRHYPCKHRIDQLYGKE